MFKAGERVYWVSHGLRRLGTIEDSAPLSLKAKVRPEKGDPEELLVRRLFHAPPDLDAARASRFLERDHSTPLAESAVDPVKREVSFIASDGSVDRFGDVLDPSGWDLKAFRRNPVFLWQHDTHQPIGTVPAIHVKDDRLIARAKFVEGGILPLADQLFRLVEAGLLCAVSIGARALADPEPIRDKKDQITGFKYGAMELLELSLVSVPANPNALTLGRKIVEEDILLKAFETDAPVANLKAYFDALRATVPGALSAPRPAKPSTSPERTHETDIRSDCRTRQAARGQSGCAGGTARQGGDRNPRPQ